MSAHKGACFLAFWNHITTKIQQPGHLSYLEKPDVTPFAPFKHYPRPRKTRLCVAGHTWCRCPLRTRQCQRHGPYCLQHRPEAVCAFWGRFHFLSPEDETTPGVGYLKALCKGRSSDKLDPAPLTSQTSPTRGAGSTAHSTARLRAPLIGCKPTQGSSHWLTPLLKDTFLLLSAQR